MKKGEIEFEIANGILSGYDRVPEKLDVVVLPKGVRVLCERSLEEFACRKLVMPSTMETIAEYAFKNADIGSIDFGGCKLQVIEDHAFENCKAKVERIPDSVHTIGAFGMYDLNIGDGKTIKLPRTLGNIGTNAINFAKASIVEVDEDSQSRLYSSVLSTFKLSRDDDWLTLKVFRRKLLIQEFVISSEFGSVRGPRQLMEWNGVNYQLYDKWFDKVQNKQCKLEMARLRVKWPIKLPVDLEIKYLSYLTLDELLKNGKNLSEVHRNQLEKGILLSHMKESFEVAARENDGERIAFWLEVLNRNYGKLEKSLEL
ncbi:MAG: leucine-rich repeat domain-containing protein [Clostridiales bacterium]|nr:leucine-rich repeat domain-containing protein [Clostridiales bacterium]